MIAVVRAGCQTTTSSVLTTLPSGRVMLQDDGDFPGYCVLEHRRHVTELYELGEPERNQLMTDIARVAFVPSPTCTAAAVITVLAQR